LSGDETIEPSADIFNHNDIGKQNNAQIANMAKLYLLFGFAAGGFLPSSLSFFTSSRLAWAAAMAAFRRGQK
jgi:hypothetical protein